METPPGNRPDACDETTWPQLKELVADALDLAPAARHALLAERCLGQPQLRHAAESLLAEADGVGDFLDDAWLPPHAIAPLPRGTRCQQYRIERLIGEGGFSEVYLATQESPFERRVALKVLKPGMDSRALLARFALERRTLARLEHPSIARILDAGATAGGRPFVVVEYVDGRTLTQFALTVRPSLRQRVELMLQVCAAVAHAHQRGVIHRDLKPGNIMVAVDGDTLTVKVIDFGIAKVLDAGVTDQTRAGMVLATPAYAAPEQLAVDGADVDTRSDVFALGVVLAELLTEAPVVRPVDAAVTLPQTCPRELGWIVARATAPAADQRYAGVAELAADLRAFLDGDALHAGPPTRAYRLRTFARRHRLALATMASVTVAVLGGAVAATLGFVRAENARVEADGARREADAIADYLARLIMAADPAQRGRDVRVVELLDASDDMLRQAAAEPDVACRLHHVIGRAYETLGEYAKSEPHLRAAAEGYAARHGELDWRGVEAACDLLAVVARSGRADAAAAMLDAVETRAERSRGAEHPRRRVLIDLRAKLAFDRGRPADAEMPLRQLLELTRADGNDVGVATLLGNLSQVLLARHRADDALPLAVEGHQLTQRHFGGDDPRTFAAARKLGAVHMARQDYGAVIALLQPLLTPARNRLGDDHPDLLGIENYLAYSLQQVGALDEAEVIYQRLLPLQQQKLAPLHPQAVMTLFNCGSMRESRGQHTAAEPLLRDACERFRQLRGPGDRDCVRAELWLGRCLAAQGRHDETAADYAAAFATARERFGDQDPMVRDAATAWLRHRLALAAEKAAGGDRAAALATTIEAHDVAATLQLTAELELAATTLERLQTAPGEGR